MAIEFRCASCQALLRVPDDRANKPVRCPHCQGVMTAPAPAEPPNPFAERLAGPAAPQEVNPYAAPKPGYETTGPYGAPPRAEAAAKVQAPAVGMMIYAGLGLAMLALNVVVYLVNPEGARFGPGPQNEAERIGEIVGVAVGSALAAALMLGILVGAWKMLQLESYGWAMAASILSLLPCSICCPVGLIFGIWGLVALNDPVVSAYFSTPHHVRAGMK